MTVATTGCELELFADAIHWKQYVASQIRSSIRGDVLEVGAGLGSTSAELRKIPHRSWTALEPEPTLFVQLQASASSHRMSLICGTTSDLASDALFDSIIYIDVLEHISDDRDELARAAAHLRPGGDLVVLCPAHNRLMSPFDHAIGHHRRYNKRQLQALRPDGLVERDAFYLDSAGLGLTIGNRVLLRKSMPTVQQIQLWDTRVVPVSRALDRVVRRSIGKSVVVRWTRPEPVGGQQ